MARPRSNSRQKIVRSAQTLFRQGYHVTGLARIVEHSGSPRGSVYFLFAGGKEEIAVEAIRAWCAEIDALLRAAAAEHETVVDWCEGVAGHFAAELQASGCTEGLPLTAVVVDSVPQSPVITAACRAAYGTWSDTTIEIFEGYGLEPERAALLANLMQAGLEGAVVLCRVHGSTEPLERLLPLVGELVAAR